MRKSGLYLGIIVLGFFLSACSKEKTATMTINDIAIYAEGPLFEGANTAQGEVANQLAAFAKEQGIDLASIHSASLKKVSLSVNDTSNFDLFSSINVQFASDQTPMVEAATINKIQPNSRLLVLTLSEKQKDLLEVLKQNKFTLVADAIITKESNTNINMTGKIEIELKY